MLEHYEALLTLYGRHNGMRIARKHLGWYARGIDGAADFRARMNGEDDPARVVAMIRALFAPVLDGALESAPVPEREAACRRGCPMSLPAGRPAAAPRSSLPSSPRPPCRSSWSTATATSPSRPRPPIRSSPPLPTT